MLLTDEPRLASLIGDNFEMVRRTLKRLEKARETHADRTANQVSGFPFELSKQGVNHFMRVARVFA